MADNLPSSDDQRSKDDIVSQLPVAMQDPLAFNWKHVLKKKSRNPATEGGLKKLRPFHKHIITYHSRGCSNREIAAILQCTEQEVSIVIRDPLSQKELQVLREGFDQELIALTPLAIDAVRAGLCDSNVKTRMTAADRVFKANGIFESSDQGKETAEDVAQRALALVAVENAQTLREVSADQRQAAGLDNIIDINPNPEED